ncbi:MAG TPA: methionyl-tRNA formyltransferase [Syntrophorhabdaceae bacterium]|nr:methionyl-tRNA formyltransferase [Syntrophorhabdaceae bacterium]HOT42603.1 methionyl-tRNA formyltransferase [Syntrophorhabdaceae bacterium]HPC65684.1 methionyl-tRNA formyltransferase [Syntrophorhabdaceae bacterium]HQE79764.1 methionyl-tRNA formyltransferase [Syntrophorhabdaceae bacterium]HQH43456.1 methionyl-tRNA formyltransferase [Syntrophorhabdaceae bacterium]
MNIVFFSTSAFSLPSFRAISPFIRCVITKRARPKGRGYMLEDSEIKKAALQMGIPVIEIDSFKEPSIFQVHDFDPHLFVVVSFGLIIPKKILDIPTIGSINVHPSLLPVYRGPSPIQWALLNGDNETGITVIKMNEQMDAGDIIYQETVHIDENDNAATLSDRLSVRSGEVLPNIIDHIEKEGKITGRQQDHRLATFTPLITKEMGRINWQAGAREINNRIRAFFLWPVAYTYIDEKLMKIYTGQTDPYNSDSPPGTIIDINKKGIYVSTTDGTLIIIELQMENKKKMDAYSFAIGYRNLMGKAFK